MLLVIIIIDTRLRLHSLIAVCRKIVVKLPVKVILPSSLVFYGPNLSEMVNFNNVDLDYSPCDNNPGPMVCSGKSRRTRKEVYRDGDFLSYL